MKFSLQTLLVSSLGALTKKKVLGHSLDMVDVPSEAAVDEFKKQNVLNQDFVPVGQEVTPDASEIIVDGEMIPLEMSQLTPIGVFTSNAKYFFNGMEQSGPPATSIYSSDTDPTVSVTMTPEGLQSVTKVDPITGETISVLPIEPDSELFVEVTASDIDPEELSKYEFIEPVSMDGSGAGNRVRRGLGKVSRSLQGCSTFRVIELAVAYDSTFCADVGGTASLANAAVERIVSATSQIYQQTGLCLKVKITAIDGFCNPSVDPYAAIIPFSVSGIATEFMRFVTNDPVRSSIPRDAFHLFYGGKPGFGAIGFAYLDVLCSNTFGFGVNEITFSSNPALQANLLAHELGHNAGSNHDAQGGQNVMSAVICDCPTFSSSSINQIISHVASVSCITPETPPVPTNQPVAAPATAAPVSPPPTQPPVPAPTPTPTTAAPVSPPLTQPPVPVPTTTAPVPAPTNAPAPAPTNAPVPAPTNAPTPAPTNAPMSPPPPPTPWPTKAPVQTSAPVDDDIILSADFDSGDDGFTYVPNTFFGVDPLAGSYNSGFLGQGVLVVQLGGIDDIPIAGVSGGWRVDLTLARASPIRVSIRYQEELGAGNDFHDYSLAICEVDGTLYGTDGNYFMSYVLGDGDGGDTIVQPYVTANLDVPTLSAGTHTLDVGAYLFSKNSASEYATMRIDSVQVVYVEW